MTAFHQTISPANGLDPAAQTDHVLFAKTKGSKRLGRHLCQTPKYPFLCKLSPNRSLLLENTPLALNLENKFNYLHGKNDRPTFAHLVENWIQQTVTAPGADLLTRYLPTSVSFHPPEYIQHRAGRVGKRLQATAWHVSPLHIILWSLRSWTEKTTNGFAYVGTSILCFYNREEWFPPPPCANQG